MTNQGTVNLLGAALAVMTAAAFLPQWMSGPDENSMAADMEKVKAELHATQWRLRELEKFIFKRVEEQGAKPESPVPYPADPETYKAGQTDKSLSSEAKCSQQELPGSDAKEVKRLEAEVKRLTGAVRTFAELATGSVGNGAKPAYVAFPRVVISELITTQMLSCQTHGEPLRSCLWVGPSCSAESAGAARAEGQVIVIDEGSAATVPPDNNEEIEAERVSILRNNNGDYQNGKCSLRIASITQADLGIWSCTLVGQTGVLFSGQVEINTEEEIHRTIGNVGPAGEGMQMHSSSAGNSKVNNVGWGGTGTGVNRTEAEKLLGACCGLMLLIFMLIGMIHLHCGCGCGRC